MYTTIKDYCNSKEYQDYSNRVTNLLSSYGVNITTSVLDLIQDYFIHTNKTVNEVAFDIIEGLKKE